MTENHQKIIDQSILNTRVDDLYRQFKEFYENPEFVEYSIEHAFSMFLIRRIATLELFSEAIAATANQVIDRLNESK